MPLEIGGYIRRKLERLDVDVNYLMDLAKNVGFPLMRNDAKFPTEITKKAAT